MGCTRVTLLCLCLCAWQTAQGFGGFGAGGGEWAADGASWTQQMGGRGQAVDAGAAEAEDLAGGNAAAGQGNAWGENGGGRNFMRNGPGKGGNRMSGLRQMLRGIFGEGAGAGAGGSGRAGGSGAPGAGAGRFGQFISQFMGGQGGRGFAGFGQ